MNKLYTATLVHAVAAGATSTHTWQLNAPKMGFLLHNFYINCWVHNNNTNQNEPINESLTQSFTLRMSRINVAEMFANPFENFTGPVGSSFPGRAFNIYKEGQYAFKGAYFEESILFTLVYYNRDIVDAYGWDITVGAEIELVKSIVS